MKQLKRIISLCLVVALLAVYTPAIAQAEETTTVVSGSCGDNLTWNLTEDGTLTISGTGDMTTFRWSSNVPWYNYRADINTAVVEDGVTSIGKYAFYYCDNLTDVIIPSTVTCIGDYSFYGCDNLTGITIADGVTSIGIYAFYDSGLTSVVIPGSVVNIGEQAFNGCDSLTSVIMQEGVANISNSAFATVELSYIEIPASVTSIGDYAFQDTGESTWYANCSRSIKFCGDAPQVGTNILSGAEGVVYYPANNDTWTDNVKESFGGDMVWIAYESNDDVVASGTSWDNTTMWTFSLNGTLSISGEGAMYDYSGTTYSSIPWYVYCGGITNVIVAQGIRTVSGLERCVNLKSITIPDSVVAIDEDAFAYCMSLTDVTIPSSVMGIGPGTFASCYSLSEITFEGSAPFLGENAFEDVTATAYYPADDSSWTATVLQNYGGTITWVSCEPDGNGSEGNTPTILANGSFCDSLTWSLTSNGTLTISGNGWMEDYLGGAEASPWYSYRYAISTVVLKNGVQNVGQHAFYDCQGLMSITIPDSVYSVDNSAFAGCTSLTGIWVDANSQYYSSDTNGVLFDKDKTTIIKVPAAICGDYTIPDSVTSIPETAFVDCVNLTSVTIPNGVTSIGEHAFAYCSSLTSVKIPGSVTSIGQRAFYDCTALTTVSLGEGIKTIGNSAFYNCNSLTNITIPQSVTKIKWGAFYNCTALAEIVFCGDAPEFDDEYTFNKVNATAYYPAGNSTWTLDAMLNCGGTLAWGTRTEHGEKELLYTDIGYCGDTQYWTLSANGILTICGTGDMKSYSSYSSYPWYDYCDDITSIVFEEGPTSIGKYAFGWCENLTSAVISDSVTNIGDYAFYFCNNLQSITIGNSVSTIGEDAFSWCRGLTGIWVDEDNLYFCNDLHGVLFNKEKTELVRAPRALDGTYDIPETVISICDNAFSNCENLAGVTIPEGTTQIGNKAFASCDGLTTVVIPNGVVSLGGSVFDNCGNLAEIVIPSSVTEIGDYVFNGCSNLSSITLADGITCIGNGMFRACESLTSINLPSSLISIGEEAFQYCEGLTKITIPENVANIGDYAFDGCTNLSEVYFSGDAVTFGHRVFGSIYDYVTANAYYPAGNETWTEAVMYDYGGDITWIPYYEILQGADSVLDAGSNETLTIRASGEFAKFESVSVDNAIVDASCYSVSEGSTIVVFHTDYLRTLVGGKHIVSIHFSDGVATTNITILVSAGDIDGDGEISDWDAIILNRYLAGWGVTINQSAADVDGDGEVSDWDAIILERYLAGWDITIG